MTSKLTFNSTNDFWGYELNDKFYYFESRNGDMLFGEGLPSNDAEGAKQAQQILRAANLAHSTAMKNLTSFKRELRIVMTQLSIPSNENS